MRPTKTHGRAKTSGEDSLAKTQVVTRTRGRAKTPLEDRSGEDTRRRGDTWAGEDTSRRQSGEDPSRREDARRCEDTWAREDRSGERTHRREDTGDASSGDSCNREAACFELAGRYFCCSKLHASTCQVLFTMAQLHDLIFLRRVHTRPRLKALAGFRARPPCPHWHRKRVVANPAPAGGRPKLLWNRGAAGSPVASGSHVVSTDVASKRGVTCPHGVREPAGIAQMWRQNMASLARGAGRQLPRACGVRTWRHLPTWRQGASCHARCGVKTWRHLPTWRQGARWHLQMWRENVSSLPHVALGSQVASPAVASKRGGTFLRGVREPRGVAVELYQRSRHWPHLASERGVKEPRGVAGCGIRRRRHTWRRRMWHQYVASEAQASRHMSSKCVFSRRAIRAPPQATPLHDALLINDLFLNIETRLIYHENWKVWIFLGKGEISIVFEDRNTSLLLLFFSKCIHIYKYISLKHKIYISADDDMYIYIHNVSINLLEV